MLHQLKEKIKSNPKLKKYLHWCLIRPHEARPRRWVTWLVNPWIHERGKGSKIRSSVRLDVVPFQPFSLGEAAIVEDFAVLNNGLGGLYIGDHTFIGISSVLIGPLNIGKEVIMAQHVVVSALNHGYEDVMTAISKQPCQVQAIRIDDACWIGANAVITAGVHIGKHSVVAAGSVVTKNVPPYTIVAGNPAKPVKAYDIDSKQWIKIKTQVS